MEGERYGEITAANERLLRFREENIRIRSSASFRFSNHLVKAIERPWKVLILPITIIVLFVQIISEAIKNPNKTNSDEKEIVVRNCSILFSDDSPGKANFQRSLAIGKSL